MSGQFLARPVDPRHRCERPGADWLDWVTEYPEGTVWQCDCGAVWVVVHVPAQSYGGRTTASHSEWQPETRALRRKRLGLRWWQREGRP